MSPALLSKRLKTLERVGVVDHVGGEYHLTAAGKELWPVIESMGVWGQRWARGDVIVKNYDASLLMWDIHRNVDVDALPEHRVVVHFHLRGSSDKKSHFWLVLDSPTVDLCLTDPGHDVDLEVAGHVETMIDYWMGRRDLIGAVRSGDLQVAGPRPLVRALPTWFTRSVSRPCRCRRTRRLLPETGLHGVGARWQDRAVALADRPLVPEEWVLRIDAVLGALPRCRQESAWTGTRWRVGQCDGGPRLRRGGPALPDHLPRRARRGGRLRAHG